MPAVFELLGTRLRAYANKDGRGYPDWAMRYRPVARELQRRRLLGGRILEVGANENGIARFVEGTIVAVDVSLEHLRAARAAQHVMVVAADAAALPFADNAFEAGVCMDTLEHVPARDRERACDELVRAVRPAGMAVMAFPSGAAAQRAESVIRAAHARFTGGTIPWLDEHEAEGLPNPDELAVHLLERMNGDAKVQCTGNANVYVWRAMWRVLACGWPGRGNALFQAGVRLLTPVLARMHFAPCYRSMIWVFPRS